MDQGPLVAHSGENFLSKRVLSLGAFFFRFKSNYLDEEKKKNKTKGDL
jgi:hypothetical protein